MATRFYFTNSSATYTPATIRGTFSDTTLSSNVYDLAKAKSGTNVAVSRAETSATNNFKVLLTRHVSGPLAGGSITGGSGAFQHVQARSETAAQANMTVFIHIYFTVGDTDVVRATYLANFVGATEFATSDTILSYTSAIPTAISIQEGDRMVVEIGYNAANTATTSWTGQVRIGGTAADLATSGTTGVTTDSAWLEFLGTGSDAALADFVNETPKSSSDTSTDVEAATLETTLTSADTSSDVEASTLATALTGADTSSMVETQFLAQEKISADTSNVIEAQTNAPQLTSTDARTVVEAATDRTLTAAETSAAVDAQTNAPQLTSTDARSVVDTHTLLSVAITSSDTGSDVEAASLSTALTGADTVTRVEAQTNAPQLTSSDVSSAAEAYTNRSITGSDTSSAVDGQSIDTGGTPKSSSDTASASEAVLARDVFSSDIGAAVEAATIGATVSSSDTAGSADSASGRSVTSADTGSTAYLVALLASIQSGDLITDVEFGAVGLNVEKSSSDSATASDVSVSIGMTSKDKARVSDAQTSYIQDANILYPVAGIAKRT